MNKTKNPKIGIIGWFGYGNAGDEAMRDICLQEFPGAVASYRSTMEKCDIYIIAGGMLIQKRTGIYLFELLDSIQDEKVYALSLGVQKGWQEQKDKVEKVLPRFEKIYTRDKQSAEELSYITKIDGVMPDLVLLADAKPSGKKYPVLFNYSDEVVLEPKGQYQDILKQGNLYPIAVMPKDVGKYATRYVTYKELISMAKSSQGLIGTRLHSIVLGVVAGIPVAGIAYSDKTRKFCQQYNIPVFEYGTNCGFEIVKSLKKADINLDKERQRINKIISGIKKDIKKFYPNYEAK